VAPRKACASPGVAETIWYRQTIYDWINERRVERLTGALRLSRASGVAIENLAGDALKSWPPRSKPQAQSSGEKDLIRCSGSLMVLLTPAPHAWTQTSAGSISALSGTVRVERAGKSIPAAYATALEVGDKLTTGPNSRVSVSAMAVGWS
jgi:hypothetical protein